MGNLSGTQETQEFLAVILGQLAGDSMPDSAASTLYSTYCPGHSIDAQGVSNGSADDAQGTGVRD